MWGNGKSIPIVGPNPSFMGRMHRNRGESSMVLYCIVLAFETTVGSRMCQFHIYESCAESLRVRVIMATFDIILELTMWKLTQ
jgi:hypothetical protein